MGECFQPPPPLVLHDPSENLDLNYGSHEVRPLSRTPTAKRSPTVLHECQTPRSLALASRADGGGSSGGGFLGGILSQSSTLAGLSAYSSAPSEASYMEGLGGVEGVGSSLHITAPHTLSLPPSQPPSFHLDFTSTTSIPILPLSADLHLAVCEGRVGDVTRILSALSSSGGSGSSGSGGSTITTTIAASAAAAHTVNALNEHSHTPLMCAAAHLSEDVSVALTRLLLEAKADVGVRDARGYTALHWASLLTVPGKGAGRVRALAESPGGAAAVNVRCLAGETALHCAARLGKGEAIEVLVAAGADPFIQSNSLHSPWDVAGHTGEVVAGGAVAVAEILDIVEGGEPREGFGVSQLQDPTTKSPPPPSGCSSRSSSSSGIVGRPHSKPQLFLRIRSSAPPPLWAGRISRHSPHQSHPRPHSCLPGP